MGGMLLAGACDLDVWATAGAALVASTAIPAAEPFMKSRRLTLSFFDFDFDTCLPLPQLLAKHDHLQEMLPVTYRSQTAPSQLRALIGVTAPASPHSPEE
jgi:hypothetical protein